MTGVKVCFVLFYFALIKKKKNVVWYTSVWFHNHNNGRLGKRKILKNQIKDL